MEASQGFVSAVFKHLKSSTIPVEERFKRVKTHGNSQAGAVTSAATMASNHTLSESKSLWKEAKHLDTYGVSRRQTALAKSRARAAAKAQAAERVAAVTRDRDYRRAGKPRPPMAWPRHPYLTNVR